MQRRATISVSGLVLNDSGISSQINYNGSLKGLRSSVDSMNNLINNENKNDLNRPLPQILEIDEGFFNKLESSYFDKVEQSEDK